MESVYITKFISAGKQGSCRPVQAAVLPLVDPFRQLSFKRSISVQRTTFSRPHSNYSPNPKISSE